MPGLVPGIDVLKRKLEGVDGRDALRAKRFAVDGNIPIPIIAGCPRSQTVSLVPTFAAAQLFARSYSVFE
jgi:hypothetical protein